MTMPYPYQTPKFVSDFKEINVDASGLDQFANSMHGQVTENFEPHVRELFKVYELGTPFGLMSYSPAVQEARRKHHECITQASDTLASYVNAAKILVAAIKKVREQYGNSDALAADNSKVVHDMLLGALAEADKAKQQALDSMRAQQIAAAHGAPISPSSLPGAHEMNAGVTTDG